MIVDFRFQPHERLRLTTTPNPSFHRRGNRLVNSNNITMKHILPLCKGELEGVVGKVKTKSCISRSVSSCD